MQEWPFTQENIQNQQSEIHTIMRDTLRENWFIFFSVGSQKANEM